MLAEKKDQVTQVVQLSVYFLLYFILGIFIHSFTQCVVIVLCGLRIYRYIYIFTLSNELGNIRQMALNICRNFLLYFMWLPKQKGASF